jgi:hypothetical protein
MRNHKNSLLLGAVAALALSFHAAEARACGGFFCSATQPVNQSAERIIFSNNGDGTVTAIIQILYQGPSENFSWLLPISTVPEADGVGIASDIAFTRLQARTNPQYNLTTTFEGSCRGFSGASGSGGSAAGPVPVPGAPTDGGGGVKVEASGVVGAFEWTVISIGASLSDPAAAAVEWLEDNGYDVSPGSPELIGPYLNDGMYLLALRLTKGSDTGSIRPISLTYEAEKPMIPIKLTAVAANDDMGVMAWVLGESRSIPFNYYALELNEARINWFNANANYNDVVTEAADEAGGKGFVTEFAGKSEGLANSVWSQSEEQLWNQYKGNVWSSFSQLFDALNAQYGSYNGFWDAVRATVVLPDEVPFEDFKSCPACYQGQFEFSPSQFFAELEENVIDPIRDVQELIDQSGYVTRLYSTLSAAEMTEDPLFSFNTDLPDVSNVHSANRVVECQPDLDQFSAPWRVELASGVIVRGTGQDFQSRTWPAPAEQPSTARILRYGESGDGQIAEDNTAKIAEINGKPAAPVGGTGGGAGTGGSATTAGRASGGTTGGTTTTPRPNTGGNTSQPTPTGGTGNVTGPGSDAGEPGAIDEPSNQNDASDDSGCSVGASGPRGSGSSFASLFALGALLTLVRRGARGLARRW